MLLAGISPNIRRIYTVLAFFVSEILSWPLDSIAVFRQATAQGPNAATGAYFSQRNPIESAPLALSSLVCSTIPVCTQTAARSQAAATGTSVTTPSGSSDKPAAAPNGVNPHGSSDGADGANSRCGCSRAKSCHLNCVFAKAGTVGAVMRPPCLPKAQPAQTDLSLLKCGHHKIFVSDLPTHVCTSAPQHTAHIHTCAQILAIPEYERPSLPMLAHPTQRPSHLDKLCPK